MDEISQPVPVEDTTSRQSSISAPDFLVAPEVLNTSASAEELEIIEEDLIFDEFDVEDLEVADAEIEEETEFEELDLGLNEGWSLDRMVEAIMRPHRNQHFEYFSVAEVPARLDRHQLVSELNRLESKKSRLRKDIEVVEKDRASAERSIDDVIDGLLVRLLMARGEVLADYDGVVRSNREGLSELQRIGDIHLHDQNVVPVGWIVVLRGYKFVVCAICNGLHEISNDQAKGDGLVCTRRQGRNIRDRVMVLRAVSESLQADLDADPGRCYAWASSKGARCGAYVNGLWCGHHSSADALFKSPGKRFADAVTHELLPPGADQASGS